MDTRMKLFALAFAAPLALAACDSGEEQQTAEVEEPATPPAGQEESAGAAQEPEESQTAAAPEESAEEPPAAAEPANPPEQDVAQAPEAGAGAEPPEAGAGQPESGAAAPAGGEMNFAGNWALEGEACPGEWEFTEQTIEVPEQGTFEVQGVQQNGQEVELEVTSMEGQQTQTLALEFPDETQPDTMIVRNGGDEVTLQRCQ